MTKLILVDSRVVDIAEIATSMAPNTEMVVFNFLDDSFESIKEKITGQYESVCIAQHNYMGNTVKFLDSTTDSIIKNVEIEDSNLSSWVHIIEFFSWLKTQAGCQYIDLLACNIWADPDWRYAILKLRELSGVYIRASVNITGAEGDFILESDNVDLIGIYFTENINNYKYQFYYQPTGTAAPHNAIGMQPNLPFGGAVNTTAYVSLVGSMLNCGTGLAGSTYVNPPTDLSDVVQFVNGAYQALPTAYAAITKTGRVVTFGRNIQGGDSSSVASYLTSGVTKVVATAMAFAALRSDGIVVSWGQVLDNNGIPANITSTTDANITPPSAVSLTNCKDIAASLHTFAALKNDGTVVQWGSCKKWASPASALVGVTKIKETYGYPSYSYIALRNDGHAVMWGAGIGTTVSLTSTSPVVDIYATDYGSVIIRADKTVYKGFTNTVTYTIPSTKNVVDVYAILNGYEFALLMDDRSMYLSDVNLVYTNVSYFNNNDNAYGFISNGAVITRGEARFGGSTTGNDGIKSGISVASGVIKLASAPSSMAALKSDGTVAVWGVGNGGWPYVSGLQSQLVNVVNIFDFWGGFIALTSDNKLISWGNNSNSWYATPSGSFSSTLTIAAGKTVSIFSALLAPFIVENTREETVSPSTVSQYASNTITFSTNVGHNYAQPGRKYGLYYGSTRIATFNPASITYSYVFQNAQFPTSGTLACSIVDYTDVSFNVGTCSITVNAAAQIAPPPSVVTSLVNENNTLTAVISSGADVQDVQLSIDGGSTYSSYPSTVVSAVNVSSSGFNIATGTAAMSTIALSSVSGGKLYAIDSARNKIMSVTVGLSAVTLVDVANSPANAKSFAISTDGSKGIICNANYCYSVNGSMATQQISDSVSRSYKAVDITSSGNRMVAMADNLYYGVWSNSILTFGQLTLANGDNTSGSCLALSKDGFIVAYSTSSAIKYAFWNGNGYNTGISISNTPASPVSMRFLQNENVLVCTALVGTTPSLFYSYWNGSIFTAWVNANVTFGLSNVSPVGLCVDSNNQVYASCVGISTVTRWIVNLSYNSITNNNLIKLTSGISSSNNYNVLVKSVTSAGTSTAGGVTNFSSDGNNLTINFTVPTSNGDTITKYSYSVDNVTFYDISASQMTTGTVVISSGFPSSGLSILTLFLRVHYATAGVVYIGSLPKSEPVIINAAAQIMSVITGIQNQSSSLIVNFINAIPNGQSVVKYQYSLNGGAYVDVSTSSVSNGSFTISGLTNGTTYSVQMRTVTNLVTSALSNSVNGTPVLIISPTPPTVSNALVSSKQAAVTYSAGGGNNILYNEYSIDGGATYVPFSSSSSTFKVFGLTNGTPTNVLVRTVTSSGVSSTSTYNVTAKDLPAAPFISGVVAGNQQLLVTVSHGDLNGGTLSGFSVSLNGGAYNTISSANIITTGDESDITITGLTNGTSYRVQVKQITEVGSSPASVSSKNNVPYTSPAVPVINSLTAFNSSVRMAFTLPSNNNGGKPIVGYKYKLNAEPTEYWVYSSPAWIPDLSNGIDYTIQLSAVNSEISSEYSASSNVVTPYNVASAPIISKILPGDGKAYVYFNELELNGSTLVKMQYNLGAAWIDVSGLDVSGVSSPITIYGLTNKVNYNIFIKVFNTAGESYPSNIKQVLVGSPQPPEITNVVFGDKQVTVSFNMPMNNGLIKTILGGASINPDAIPVMAKLTGTPLLTDSSYTVILPKLANGTPYYVRLQIANTIGTSAYSNVYGPIIPAGRPPALMITNAVANSVGSAMIYVAPTTNNGDAISKIMYTISGDPFIYDLSGLSSPFTVPGLSVNRPYIFTLYSQNKAGMSLPSKPSKPVTITYVIPVAPSKITTMAYRDPSSTYLSPLFYMRVSFVPPSINPLTPITTYKYVVSTTSGSTSVIDASTTVLPLKIQINPNIAYSVKVIATNMVGDSAQSIITTPVTSVFLPPFPPLIKTVSQIGSGSIKIEFTPSTLRGVPVTKYVYTTNAGATYVDMTMNASGNLIASDLSNNVPIATFQVVAQSEIGNSTLSPAAKPFTILYTVPAAPVLANPVVSGTSATINYPVPLANGSPITGYVATITHINAAKAVTVSTQNVASPPLALTGLSAGNYSVVVRAVNALGQSAPSAAKTFVIA